MEGLIWIHNNLHGSQSFNMIVKYISMLGNVGFIWITIAIILLFFKKTRKSALIMLISLSVGFIFNDLILKNLIARDRPFVSNVEFIEFLKSINMDLPSGYSFPSGHTFSSINCAVVLSLCDKKFAYWTIPLAIMIALSRIFLCVHYPTDVLFGAILGILVAIIVYSICQKIIKVYYKKQREIIRNKKC